MRTLIALIILNVFSYQNYAQTGDAITNRLTKDLEVIYSQGHIIGFSVAIVNQEGILFNQGFGYADKNENKKYTENTIQNIASISKTFIGVALLKAQEMKKLDLDDSINKYLPFKVKNPYFPEEPITIRQLATHTSSIKDPSRYEKNGYVLLDKDNGEARVKSNFRPPEDMMILDSFLGNILNENGEWYKKSNYLKNKPGEIFKYSNVAAGLAALVLENATDQTFDEFTKRYIFTPLEMSQTGWFRNEVDLSLHSKLYTDQEKELAAYQLVNFPDGALITSSGDLGKYLSELISGYYGNGKILHSKSFETLFKPNLTAKNYKERDEGVYNDEYNMGIFMGISAQGQIGHTGGDPGVVTHMFFNTKTKVGKILIANTDLDKEGIKEFIDVWNKLAEYENKL